jgi:hypothetical protein
MDQPRTDPDCRNLALRQLRHFAERVLPGTVRRILSWKGLPRPEADDLVAEVTQELSLDCLQRGAALVALPQKTRHSRWMRLTERWIYRNRVRWLQHAPDTVLDEQPGHQELSAHPEDLLAALGIVRLRNGRCNVRGSSRGLRRSVSTVKNKLLLLAQEHGMPPDQERFWRHRVGEALVGLAADLLQDSGQLWLLPRPRHRPDPAGRLRRIRRLHNHVPILGSSRATRTALRIHARQTTRNRIDPTALLRTATALCPESPVAWAWLAEACLMAGDLRGAMHAVRGARHNRAPRSSVLLLRVRLLDLRQRPAAAAQLLQRALRRWPREHSLQRAFAAARTPAGKPAQGYCGNCASDCATTPASSRSARTSGSMSPQ